MAKKDTLNYSNLAACKSSAKTDIERKRCESKFNAKKTSKKQIYLIMIKVLGTLLVEQLIN
jgi:hypothetical protein